MEADQRSESRKDAQSYWIGGSRPCTKLTPGNSNDPTGLFLVLEGPDGVGKTTLSKEVGDALAAMGVRFLSRRAIPDGDPFLKEAFEKLADLLWNSRSKKDVLLPLDYWLHLQASWYAAFSKNVLGPALRENRAVITDGWFYKFVAKLLVRDVEYEYLAGIFRAALRPDKVFLLDLDAESIWQRRKSFSYSEMGLHQGYTSLGKESFIDYQSRIVPKFDWLAERYGWAKTKLRPEASIGENREVLAAAVAAFLEEQTHSPAAAPMLSR